MTKYTLPPMRPELVVCPNSACGASERIGIHSRRKRRYICHACGKTFAETVGTPLYGLKHPAWLVIVVLSWLAGGCPVSAIVLAFGLDERTVADWRHKAGRHAKAVQEQLVCAGQLELGQIQADELYVKTQRGAVWMATAMRVFSRLFVWGALAPARDTTLVKPGVERVRAAAKRGPPLLWATDGFGAWAHAIVQVFRDKEPTGKRGRPPLVVWQELHIVQVVKQYSGRRLRAIERRLKHGCREAAEALMQASQVNLGVINTASIERLNATFRTCPPALTRRSRTPARQVAQLEAAMFWMGVVYNFCRVHATLQGTPAMAAGLSEHVWSVDELIRFRCKRE